MLFIETCNHCMMMLGSKALITHVYLSGAACVRMHIHVYTLRVCVWVHASASAYVCMCVWGYLHVGAEEPQEIHSRKPHPYWCKYVRPMLRLMRISLGERRANRFNERCQTLLCISENRRQNQIQKSDIKKSQRYSDVKLPADSLTHCEEAN